MLFNLIFIIMETKNNFSSKKFIVFCQKIWMWSMMLAVIGGIAFLWHHITFGTVILTMAGTGLVVAFFFAGFAPPKGEVDWSLVYPELAGLHNEPFEVPNEIIEMKAEIENLKNEILLLKR